MGNFYSVLHHVINWMTHKQGQPVDQVAEWLRENDLEEYFPNFVNYGWDHLSVISEMTESDIEMCIQKPGHKVKLKRALNHLKGNPSIDSSTAIYTSSDQEARRTANTETLLSSANNSFNISEDTQALTDSLQPRQYCSAVASKASNVQSDFESDQENMFEGDGSIIMDIQELDEPVSTPLENQKVDTEEGPTVSSSDTEQQIYGITMESKSDLESTESDVTDHSETENDIATDVNKKLADTNTLR